MATILHADMDAFYASVEQLDRPELRGKPVIVGGTGNRGVVSAASYEARPFGVHSAMPTHEARRLCPHGIFLPGRMKRYAEVSRQIRGVFREFTPAVEPLSLDEAFLDVTGSLRLFGSALEIGRRLKRRVHEESGLTVSVGIGPGKMVAKIAGDLGKPDGLVEVAPDEVRAFLDPLPVGRLWGAGPVAREKLAELGIVTIGDLARTPIETVRHRLGSLGAALHALANGNDGRMVEADLERKSYGEENTFSRDVRDGEDVRRTIVAHAEAVARRLRADRRRARTVTLKVKLTRRTAPGKYPLVARSTTFPMATDDGKRLGDAALDLWAGIADGLSIRLVGVTASNIEATSAEQLGLFAPAKNEQRDSLNRALDEIAARFGEDVVSRGGAHVERAAPTGRIKDSRKEQGR